MQNPGPRRAFEESVRRGWLVEPRCVDGVPIDVSYVHRFDSSNVRRLNMNVSWCARPASATGPSSGLARQGAGEASKVDELMTNYFMNLETTPRGSSAIAAGAEDGVV